MFTQARNQGALGVNLSSEDDVSQEDEPSEDEIREYAMSIGIDPNTEKDLMWIARTGIVAPLPSDDWDNLDDERGQMYFFNYKTGESSWEHPSDDKFRAMVKTERQNLNRPQKLGAIRPKSAAPNEDRTQPTTNNTRTQPMSGGPTVQKPSPLNPIALSRPSSSHGLTKPALPSASVKPVGRLAPLAPIGVAQQATNPNTPKAHQIVQKKPTPSLIKQKESVEHMDTRNLQRPVTAAGGRPQTSHGSRSMPVKHQEINDQDVSNPNRKLSDITQSQSISVEEANPAPTEVTKQEKGSYDRFTLHSPMYDEAEDEESSDSVQEKIAEITKCDTEQVANKTQETATKSKLGQQPSQESFLHDYGVMDIDELEPASVGPNTIESAVKGAESRPPLTPQASLSGAPKLLRRSSQDPPILRSLSTESNHNAPPQQTQQPPLFGQSPLKTMSIDEEAQKEEHEQKVQELEEKYKNELESSKRSLEAELRANLADLRRKNQEELNKKTKILQEENQDEINRELKRLRENMQEQIKSSQAEHATRLANLQTENREQINKLNADHRLYVEILKEQHQAEVKRLEDVNQQKTTQKPHSPKREHSKQVKTSNIGINTDLRRTATRSTSTEFKDEPTLVPKVPNNEKSIISDAHSKEQTKIAENVAKLDQKLENVVNIVQNVMSLIENGQWRHEETSFPQMPPKIIVDSEQMNSPEDQPKSRSSSGSSSGKQATMRRRSSSALLEKADAVLLEHGIKPTDGTEKEHNAEINLNDISLIGDDFESGMARLKADLENMRQQLPFTNLNGIKNKELNNQAIAPMALSINRDKLIDQQWNQFITDKSLRPFLFPDESHGNDQDLHNRNLEAELTELMLWSRNNQSKLKN